MRATNKLTAAAVAKQTRPGLYGDGLGLYLQVSKWGTKSWLFRYQIDKQPRKMGLGPTHTVTLAMAREKATECRRKLLEGIDPIDQRQEERQEQRAAKAAVLTFEEAAGKYIDANKAGWKNAKHAAQWTATLETYAYPHFGKLDVAKVDLPHVLKALEPIWTEKAETAARLRGRIENILDWATVRKYRTGENPARWRGHLDHILPARSKVQKVEHHAALPYAQVAAFMEELRALEAVSARALEFAILTAARTGEVVGARWQEIDLDAKLWTVPAARMKAGKEHRVPLSARAVAILRALPREDNNPHVFIGDKKGKGLSNMALLMTLRRMDKKELTVHGFRSTFRDWAAETTSHPNEMVEIALAHTIGNKAEAAYRRGDQMEKRRRMMEQWATYCATKKPEGKVVPIRAAN